MEEEICWADQVGDRWESEGIDPGRIFETGETLGMDCLPGIMMVTKNLPPGSPPQYPWQLERAIVQFRGTDGKIEEINLVSERGCRPIFVANWTRIQPTLC